MKISVLFKYKWQITGWLVTLGICLVIAFCTQDMVIVRPLTVRPVIADRDGNLLIKNRPFAKPRQRRRYAVQNGKFAAMAIGFTSINEADNEVGMAGVERMFNGHENEYKTVYLTLDTEIQLQFENLVTRIYKGCTPNYVYASAIRSNGEIVAIAQRPVIDLNDRSNVNPHGMVNFNAEYRLPVTDELMKLLGSSSAAPIEEKAKLDLVEKLGVFPHDIRGTIIGMNRVLETDKDVLDAGIATTALHYLRIFAAKNEKTAPPRLKFYSGERFSKLDKVMSIKWNAFSRSKSALQLTAVGILQTQNGENIYFLYHSAHKTSDGADKATNILKAWSIKND